MIAKADTCLCRVIIVEKEFFAIPDVLFYDIV